MPLSKFEEINMKKTRNALIQLINAINTIKDKYIAITNDMIELSGEAEVDRTMAHYDQAIASLEKELQTHPIGYRYTGIYYLKKPYTQPPIFEKHSGSLYMQEHLVSWQVENDQGKLEYPYYRAVYKQPEGELITREDAKQVYSE